VEADRGAFKVPTLRNLRETNPYFHTGLAATIEQAVAHEAARSGIVLTDDEVRSLSAFLERGLTDESGKPDRPRAVPSGLSIPLDGFRIPR
jgi:cytochrome c peroxidase